ncbi:MAG: LapA family protein [Zoogloeaceae bacterium]|jgi:uncharacterized integral membrane protein|nr:LapA family protein [Zoogloeaceae bacterium]
MRILAWGLRLLLFLLVFIFALKNSAPVPLHVFTGPAWLVPLSVLLLCAFAAGVFLSLLVTLGALFTLRREAARLRGEIARLQEAQAAPAASSMPGTPDYALPSLMASGKAS